MLPVIHQYTWFQNAGVKLTVGTQIDGLAVMMMFVVTLISLLVHVYSLEYMRGDRRYTHFYAALSLFTASMLLLVVASNTLEMLVGWELVGLCSFMLIGHWWEEKPNSDAALKAFLTTRTGDIGLLIGVIMTYFVAQSATGHGTFNILVVNASAASAKVSHTLVMWTALALLLAIIGKSGQFPLHTWLPDAMAGPTPVSALIHAATMVVAGVYLGARLYPVFWYGLSIGTPGHGGLNAMAVIGGITVLIGAALAFVQDDIKKVLAYSTISQLGYMVMALGVGAWTAAVFHLFTHAFFKADLFLGAGSVSHSGSHHSFDMKKDMGGLKKYMPKTFWTFVIGSLALAGIFPLAGFWSKDEILVNAGHNGYQGFLVIGAIGAFMTAAYMTRCVYLTFFGEYRGSVEHELAEVHEAEVLAEGDELVEHHLAEEQDDYIPGFGAHAAADEHGHGPHESNGLITVPLYVLSFFAIFAGVTQHARHRALREVVPAARRVRPGAPGQVQRDRRGDLTRDRARRLRCRVPLLLAQGRSAGPLRAQRAGARRQALPRHEVLPRRAVHRHHRRVDQGPDRRRRLLVQSARHRQRVELCRPRRGGGAAGSRTSTSTRRASTRP